MRALSPAEQQHNNLRRFLGMPTLKVTQYDVAKKLCRKVLGSAATEEMIDSSYFLFVKSNLTPEEVRDYIQWRKCTDQFFSMKMEIYPEGRKLLSILANPSYCYSKYHLQWKEFNDYYIEITKTINYIQKNMSSTWSKLPKKEKLKKIEKLKRTVPFFDRYNFLATYKLNQINKALTDKLNTMKFPNLHEDDIYEDAALKIAVDGFKKYSPIIMQKIHKLFIEYFIEYQTNYKNILS